MFSHFENRKTTYFDVFCLNFSKETRINILFLISYFNLSKKKRKTKWHFGYTDSKATLKIEQINVSYMFTNNVCSVCNSMQVVVFCKTELIL